MCHMTGDWARLGAMLKAARKAHGLQQQDVAHRIGVSRGAIHNIEKGEVARLTGTIREYARLLGWGPGSPTRVLAGGDPEPQEPDPDVQAATAIASADLPADLSARVKMALAEGPLVDSQTVTVPVAGGKLTATIVVRGRPDASPEELREQLLELRDKEWELRSRDD